MPDDRQVGESWSLEVDAWCLAPSRAVYGSREFILRRFQRREVVNKTQGTPSCRGADARYKVEDKKRR